MLAHIHACNRMPIHAHMSLMLLFKLSQCSGSVRSDLHHFPCDLWPVSCIWYHSQTWLVLTNPWALPVRLVSDLCFCLLLLPQYCWTFPDSGLHPQRASHYVLVPHAITSLWPGMCLSLLFLHTLPSNPQQAPTDLLPASTCSSPTRWPASTCSLKASTYLFQPSTYPMSPGQTIPLWSTVSFLLLPLEHHAWLVTF